MRGTTLDTCESDVSSVHGLMDREDPEDTWEYADAVHILLFNFADSCITSECHHISVPNWRNKYETCIK